MPETVPVQCPECGERVEATPGEKSRCPMCGTAVSTAGGEAGKFYDPAAADLIEAEIADLKATRRTNNLLSFAFAAVAIAVSIGAQVLFALSEGPPEREELAFGGLGAMLLALVGWVVAFSYYARYKGRHVAWALCGLVGCLGVLLLLLLKDLNGKRLAVLEAKAELARGR